MIPAISIVVVIIAMYFCSCLRDKLFDAFTFIVAEISAIIAYLNEEDVCYFFSYYAIVAYLMKDKFIEDYNDKSWERFRQFAEKMQNTAKTKGYFKFKVDETNNNHFSPKCIKTRA